MRHLLISLLLASGTVHAVPASFTPDKAELLCGAEGIGTATWSGACRDGLADGAGIATWTEPDHTKVRFAGTLVRGRAGSTVDMTFGRTLYIGTLDHFTPHGQGFFKFAGGDMYEGGLDHGLTHGPGIWQDADKSRYEGEWAAGKREGQGRATYTLGGSYDGHWHDDVFDGAGTIVYAGSGRTYTGQFKDGRVAGTPAPPAYQRGDYQITHNDPSYGFGEPELAATHSPLSGGPWTALSAGERQTFKSGYKALEDGDEPPYPLDGLRPMISAISTLQGTFFDHYGQVRMNVLVGADGKAKSATTVGRVRDDVARYVGQTLMLTPYKPALCHGKPCDMIFAMCFYLE